MRSEWLIQEENHTINMNVSPYTCIMDNHSFNEQNFLERLTDFFQPRSKMKDQLKVIDIANDEEEITHNQAQFFMISNMDLLEEVKLGAKSLFKQQIKNDFSRLPEFHGYLQTINTLIEDVVQLTDTTIPLKSKQFTSESFMKSMEVAFSTEEEIDYRCAYERIRKLFPYYIKSVKDSSKAAPYIIYFYPEHLLSPKEQEEMKKMLKSFSNQITIIVLSKSKYFLAENLFENNMFIWKKQQFDEELIEDMVWNAPLDYSKEEIYEAFSNIIQYYAENLETTPVVSNYKIADIAVFKEIELYVLIYFMNKQHFDFQLDLQWEVMSEAMKQFTKTYAEI
jgi:hypothetical protein